MLDSATVVGFTDRMTRDQLVRLLESGELTTIAKTCATQHEMATRLGLTKAAYEGLVKRLRNGGYAFPKFAELAGRLPYGDSTLADAVVQAIEEEATRPIVVVEAVEEEIEEEEEVDPLKFIEDALADRKERAQISQAKAQLNAVLVELEKCKLELATAIGAKDARTHVDPIEPREKTSLRREAVAVALASDWHIEETVELASVNGANEYNLDIAKHRVSRFFSGYVYLIKYHQPHFLIRDALLWLGGDLITGYLREENLESNQVSPVQAIATLHVWLAEGIRHVLASTDIAMLRIVCNSGNHGRLTDKIRPSTREANSIEWLLYMGLAREFENEPRIQFVLPHGSHTYVEVYGRTIRFTHGDDIKSGGGIGGVTIPIYKALARWATFKHADLTVMGHWHQYHDLSDLVINGSLIGFNPYALAIGARYEEPRQAFFLLDTKRFKTMPADIWVKDIEEES